MIATMSPASYNFDESISSLRYANRAKNIKNKPKINEDPKDAMLREFEEEIKKLRAQLEDEGDEDVEEEDEEEQFDPKSGKLVTKKKTHVNHHPSAAEIERMQNLVEEEKRTILASKDLEESERNVLVADLEKRAAELETERLVKSGLEEKLKQLEAKLLLGGVSVIDTEERQRMELAHREAEMEFKKGAERDLQRALEESESANIQIEEEYSSLKEAAAAKTRKLKKLWSLAVDAKSEVKDLQQEHQRERESLLESVRDVTRELKLRIFLINQFIPAEYM
jgi:kinesin family protein 3/17